MKPIHLVAIGFASVVVAKVLRGLLAGWLNVNI